MKKFRLTEYESSWIRIVGLVGFFTLAVYFLSPFLPKTNQEPLADRVTLSLLANGKPVPMPQDNPNALFHGQKAIPPKVADLAHLERTANGVLGVTSDQNHIEVDLAHQRLYAFEGSTKVFDFPVSTGKWGPTPTGEFHIWTKVRSTLMAGGEGADAYYLPNVPYVMFFSNNEVSGSRGFSLHGTYWHNNFGHPMSHGCVNMRTEDAKVLFDWATPVVTDAKGWSTPATNDNPGTKIVIYGTPPTE